MTDQRPGIAEMHAALDRAGVPMRFRRFQRKTFLTHDWYELDALERWKVREMAIADAALAEMTDRCRTAEQRAWNAITKGASVKTKGE